MAYKIWLFLWYFVLASFCGWVAEVGYIGMVYRKFKNPGMLNLSLIHVSEPTRRS